MIDREKAKNKFLENVGRLSYLPFVTDSEMDGLFGEDVSVALMKLDHYNRREQICVRCESRCCQATGCEFYAVQFTKCPIHDLRPAFCRLHFCSRFQPAMGSLTAELSEIFLDNLSVAEHDGCAAVQLFDSPPFARHTPYLINVTSLLVNAVREGRLDPQYAEVEIHQDAEKYLASRISGLMELHREQG
jgi:hypothetical protein